MPRAIDITATVDDRGRLPEPRRRFVRDQLRLYAGREVRVRISSPARSSAANRYYWGAVIAEIVHAMNDAGMMVETGGPGRPVTDRDVHELMKSRHLPVRTVTVDDVPLTMAPSTADLDSTAFYDYVEAIREDELVLALGVYIDEPDPELRSHAIAEP